MTPESTGEARTALAPFPGIADITLIELDVGQAGQCPIARATIMVVDEITLTAVEAVTGPVRAVHRRAGRAGQRRRWYPGIG